MDALRFQSSPLVTDPDVVGSAEAGDIGNVDLNTRIQLSDVIIPLLPET